MPLLGVGACVAGSMATRQLGSPGSAFSAWIGLATAEAVATANATATDPATLTAGPSRGSPLVAGPGGRCPLDFADHIPGRLVAGLFSGAQRPAAARWACSSCW